MWAQPRQANLHAADQAPAEAGGRCLELLAFPYGWGQSEVVTFLQEPTRKWEELPSLHFPSSCNPSYFLVRDGALALPPTCSRCLPPAPFRVRGERMLGFAPTLRFRVSIQLDPKLLLFQSVLCGMPTVWIHPSVATERIDFASHVPLGFYLFPAQPSPPGFLPAGLALLKSGESLGIHPERQSLWPPQEGPREPGRLWLPPPPQALPHPSLSPPSGCLPPAWSMAVRMEGNQEVSLLLAWNSCCRSVKKMPTHTGKPRVRPCATTVASRTTQAQPPSARSTAWGIVG